MLLGHNSKYLSAIAIDTSGDNLCHSLTPNVPVELLSVQQPGGHGHALQFSGLKALHYLSTKVLARGAEWKQMTILSLADVVCDSSCQMGKDREAIGAAFAERDSGTLGESREKHAMAEARQVNKPFILFGNILVQETDIIHKR